MSIEVTPGVPGASGKTQTSVYDYDDGTLTGESSDVRSYVASGAIVRGEAVVINVPSYAAGPPVVASSVTVSRLPVVGTLAGSRVIGVALNDAEDGDIVKVACDHGWVRGTATAGQGMIQSATAGVAAGEAAALTTVNRQFGTALAAHSTGVFPSVTSPATNTTTTGVFVSFRRL